jgi:hypothetical protein
MLDKVIVLAYDTTNIIIKLHTLAYDNNDTYAYDIINGNQKPMVITGKLKHICD